MDLQAFQNKGWSVLSVSLHLSLLSLRRHVTRNILCQIQSKGHFSLEFVAVFDWFAPLSAVILDLRFYFSASALIPLSTELKFKHLGQGCGK